jgi:hypothetical protein
MSLPASLQAVDHYSDPIRTEFGKEPLVLSTIERFLRIDCYDRQLCTELLRIARGEASRSWEFRRLAVLMLEHQILKLSPEDISEHRFLFRELRIQSLQSDETLSDEVLKEGFTTTRLGAFIHEFRNRLARLNRVHFPLSGSFGTSHALVDFVRASRTECKLTLGRYLFDPGEVVARITSQLKTSAGITDVAALNQPHVRREIDHWSDRLPRFEVEVLNRLCERSRIYWVSADTRSEINSLVEYPLNTVVVVLKPPGSDLEFEIKRAGTRGKRPLEAIYYQDGFEVPPTHRLFGGSMGYYLRWEAGSAADLSKIYRLIHNKEAPISRTRAVSTIYTVPCNGEEQHIVRYFCDMNETRDPEKTRAAMRYSIEAFQNETGMTTPSVDGDFGIATEFLGQVTPSQSILTGTSSFRLDRLASYLSPDGAALYFDGLKRSFTAREAAWFGDELLEEALGVYSPPQASFEDYGRYIDAALSQPDNRARADKTYLEMLRVIGEFWGTLLGMRSYTYGESFVARNVGIKSVFQEGEWSARMVFLDHDVMYLSGRRSRDFHPLSAIPGMAADDRHVWGFHHARGEVELLRTIYKVDHSVEDEGHSALRDSMRQAYRTTQEEICQNERVRGFFHSPFAERVRDWDEVSIPYLDAKGDPQKTSEWRERAERALFDKGYSETLVDEYLKAIEKHHGFIEKYSFLPQLK